MDSQLGESGYSLGGRGGEGGGGRGGTLQRIPEEPATCEGWPQPTSIWPLVKEQSKKEKETDEEVLIRPGELSIRSVEFTKRPENPPADTVKSDNMIKTIKSDQTKLKSDNPRKTSEVEKEKEEEEELGISHQLILHTKETFIA